MNRMRNRSGLSARSFFSILMVMHRDNSAGSSSFSWFDILSGNAFAQKTLNSWTS